MGTNIAIGVLSANQLICVYNKQNYVLKNAADRTKLDTFIDSNFKTVSNAGNSKPTSSNNGNATGLQQGNLGAQGDKSTSFFEKYKIYLMIGGGVVAVLVVGGILTAVLRRSGTKEKGRKSAVSIESAGTAD